MTTFLKILLAVSAALFLASLTEAGSAILWGFLKPLSAILFIVFFIGQLLHKEVVKYDEECRVRLADLNAPESRVPQRSTTSRPDQQQIQAISAPAR